MTEYTGLMLGDVMPYTCSVCDKEFARKWHLSEHEREHKGEKSLACIVCSKSFEKNSDLTRHLRIHTGVRPFTCNTCNKTFMQKTHLKSHLKGHRRETFICNVCNKIFKSETNLTGHIQIVHISVTRFTCNICKKKFSRKVQLIKHEAEHTGVSPFTCSICNKIFGRKADLQAHLKVHSGEKPFTYNVCSKQFTWKYAMTRHINSVHGAGKPYSGEELKPFTCNLCNKNFTLKSTMTRHMKMAHGAVKPYSGEKPKPFTCNVCNKQFTWKSSMTKHIKLAHGAVKPSTHHVCNNDCPNHKVTHEEKEQSSINVDSSGQGQPAEIPLDKVPYNDEMDEQNTSLNNCSRKSCNIVTSEDDWEGSNVCSTDEANDTRDNESAFCKFCGTKYSESWCDVDIDCDYTFMFCKQCQHISIPCVFCCKMVELCFLRSHVGQHMGESVI